MDEKREILISPGYGSGFVSDASGSREFKKFLLEYRPFIEAIKAGREITPEMWHQLRADAGRIDPKGEVYLSKNSMAQLAVERVPVGVLVRIDEYDGYESISYQEGEDWL